MPKKPTVVEVNLMDKDYRAPASYNIWWEMTGALLDEARKALGDTMGISVVMSRLATELRRDTGVEGAKQAFRGMIDTMDAAAEMEKTVSGTVLIHPTNDAR